MASLEVGRAFSEEVPVPASKATGWEAVHGRRAWFWYVASMRETSETRRLADAINPLALTMTEIIAVRLRAAADLQEHRIANKMIDPMLNKGDAL